jgi:hypothetical protein
MTHLDRAHSKFEHKYMIYLHSKFRMDIPNVSLVIVIKSKAKCIFHAEVISYSTVYQKKSK